MATVKTVSLPSYAPGPLPILPSGEGPYAQKELKRVGTTLAEYRLMLPQGATAEPVRLVDGMIRLARAPWHPVSGQTADKWVYYDGAASIWRLLGTDPTDTT